MSQPPYAYSGKLNAQIDTSFKGDNLSLKGTLDLNKLRYDPEEPIQVHHHVATQNHIDQYSYLYEMLEMEPVLYTSDDPIIQQCITPDGEHFDWECYEQKRRQHLAVQATKSLLNEYFSEQEQKENPNLEAALREAYLLGQQAKS
jgi:hypothetical protein